MHIGLKLSMMIVMLIIIVSQGSLLPHAFCNTKRKVTMTVLGISHAYLFIVVAFPSSKWSALFSYRMWRLAYYDIVDIKFRVMVSSFQSYKDMRERILQRPSPFGGGVITFNCVWGGVCTNIWSSEGNMKEWVLSLHWMGSRDQTQLPSLACRYPCPWTFLACQWSPSSVFFPQLSSAWREELTWCWPLSWMLWHSTADVGPRGKAQSWLEPTAFFLFLCF